MSRRWAVGCLALLGFVGLDTGAFSKGEEAIEVAVSIGPLAEIVERIGGESVRVTVLTPPATPPESWAPTPREALALARSDLYVAVGHPLLAAERPHLESVARQVDGLARLSMLEPGDSSYSTAAAVDDPHLWMDIDALASTAKRLAAWLTARRPGDAAAFAGRLEDYLQELDLLDARLGDLWAAPHDRPAVFQHPAWSRLLDRYGVESLSIEIEGKEPSPVRLAGLIERARDQGAERIFTQIGVSDRGARLLAAEIGADLEALDPTSRLWLETLERVGQRVAEAIRW